MLKHNKSLNNFVSNRLFQVVLILIITFCLFQGIRYLSFDDSHNFTLGGTYTCKALPFDSISFEIDDSNKFTYYYHGGETADSGTFLKVSDGLYTLNSNSFHTQSLSCYKKFPSENGFYIEISGVKCKFVQQSSVPSHMNQTSNPQN